MPTRKMYTSLLTKKLDQFHVDQYFHHNYLHSPPEGDTLDVVLFTIRDYSSWLRMVIREALCTHPSKEYFEDEDPDYPGWVQGMCNKCGGYLTSSDQCDRYYDRIIRDYHAAGIEFNPDSKNNPEFLRAVKNVSG